MRPQDVRLPAPMADELRTRADALLALGTLGAEAGPGDAAAIAELAERLQNTYPYPDPMYAGQMLKPPAPVAWAAYATAMLLNPNNHALDGGPATAELEREAVEQLRVMLGVPAPGLGAKRAQLQQGVGAGAQLVGHRRRQAHVLRAHQPTPGRPSMLRAFFLAL